MNTRLIFTLSALAAAISVADDVRLTVEGGGLNGSFRVTTNVTSCGRINWDGVPDGKGAMSGGQYEITVQLVNNEVVIQEETHAADKGIRSQVTAKTIVPVDRIPWTGKLSGTTATVSRVDHKMEQGKVPTRNPVRLRKTRPNLCVNVGGWNT